MIFLNLNIFEPNYRSVTLVSASTIPHHFSIASGIPASDLNGEGLSFKKGGDPAAPSDTATLLRLHPLHEFHLRSAAPCGYRLPLRVLPTQVV